MIGTGDPKGPVWKMGLAMGRSGVPSPISVGIDELRLRAQLLSLREQIERHHFLLQRLNAGSARLLQSLGLGDAFEAIAEIMANLIGCEELAIFHYHSENKSFSLDWSQRVEAQVVQKMASGAGMLGRAVHNGVSQFRDRQPDDLLLPYEKNLTACIVLKSGQEVSGAIAIFGLLPPKPRLEWLDFELLKFLEVYGAVAIQYQRIQRNMGTR